MAQATRRMFLKGAATIATTGVLGSTMAGTALASDAAPDTPVAGTPGYNVQVHESDVVIVGGGIAATTAARRAMAKGVSVTLVDKGPWGHSGTSGMNWGHNAETNEWSEGDGSDTVGVWVYLTQGMLNQPNGLGTCMAVHAGRPCATFEQLGCTLERGHEGHTAAQNSPGFVVDNGTFNRYPCLDLERKGAQIHDRTMVTELLLDQNGQAAGVTAIDLVTGAPHVFRGKAIVFATGSYRWVSGFNGMKPHTIAGPENTGDGLAILMRKGVAMRDMEEQPIDFVQWTPLGVRTGMGSQGASTINWKFMYDANHEKLVPEEIQSVSNGELARLYYRAQLEGRGTENGGVYVVTNDPQSDDRYYRRCRENEQRFLNYELPEYTEVVAEQWEDAGHPFVYDAAAQTELPGLYYAASGQGSWGGCGFFGAFGTGYQAGDGAAERALTTECAPEIDWEAAGKAFDEAYGLLDGNGEDGLRPTVVFRHIQEAYWDGLSPLRNEEGILTAIDKLARIEAEELPKMVVPQKSLQYNTDWHRALEARNMLMCAQATAQAALLRKECRGAHVREDYPVQDNQNFMVSTKVSWADGAWTASLEPLEDQIIPTADVQAMIPTLNLL